MEDGARIRNIICAVLCIVLAGALILLIYTENQKEKAQSAAIQAIQEEAAPYEKELQTLKNELSNLKDGVSYSSEAAEIMVGFVTSDASDLDYIAGMASTYDFPPVLVIDCTMEIDIIENIIEAADESWEIMLYAPTFSDEVNEDVLFVISYLEEEGKEHTGVFFLRGNNSTDENLQLLKDDGFTGYTRFSNTAEEGQNKDGTIYFDYTYMGDTDASVADRITVMESKVATMYSNNTSMLIAFDMSSINTVEHEESCVTEAFAILQNYTEKDNCSYSTVASVVEELSRVNPIEADNQVEYEKQAAEIQKRIDELEDIISEIYDKLEYR